MRDRLIQYRFELFLLTEIAILFGALVVPNELFDSIFSPLFFYLNLLVGGIILISKKRYRPWFVLLLLIVISLVYGSDSVENFQRKTTNFIRMGITFLFYILVTLEIIIQIWKAEIVNKNVIFGVICGYITLGLIAFFTCLTIEIAMPGSFEGLLVEGDSSNTLTERLMYYSYITMLTIGYGDIIPINLLAQKASVLIGLMGQFYLVIITAIIVGKYISQTSQAKKI